LLPFFPPTLLPGRCDLGGALVEEQLEEEEGGGLV